MSCGEAPSAILPGITTTDEDVPLVLTLDGEAAVSAEVTIAPQNGTLSAVSGELPLTASYTPAADFNGSDRFTFVVTAEDGTASDPIEVALTVRPVNDAPTITSTPTLTATEGQAYSTTITAADVDGGALTFRAPALPSWLSLASATLSGTPAHADVGSHDVVVEVEDADGATATQAFTITVADVNGTPTATALTLTTAEDVPLSVGLSGADRDNDGLTFVVAAQPQNGTLSGSGASLVYTPAANFNGTDSFTYTASDGRLTSPAATVSITVTPVNDAPVATAADVSTAEDTAAVITLAGTDIDGNALTFAVVDAPQNGTLSGTPPALTFTPAADFNGSDRFTFTVSDGTATSVPATVRLTVTPVNDAPRGEPSETTIAEDSDGVEVAFVAVDPEGSLVAFEVVTQPQNGTVTAVDSGVRYVPAANFNGTDTFTWLASDGQADSAPVTATIVVTPVNDAPTMLGASVTTPEDTAVDIPLVANDVDGDTLTFAVGTAPTLGTVEIVAGAARYIPAANVSGVDTFTVVVNDGTVDGDEALITVTITPVRDAALAVDDTFITETNQTLVVSVADLALNDVDPDGSAAVTTVFGATNGAVRLSGGLVEFRPTRGFVGTAGFRYTLREPNGTFTTAAVTVSVAAEICGSGAVSGDEECDDGNTVEGDGCNAACILEVCGNGFQDAGEECDEGIVGNDGIDCDPNCRLPGCGNGFLGAGEACDDGNTNSDDGCTDLCVIERCGDGIPQAGIGEQCDDGANGIDTDGCNDLCQTTVCGDGDLDGAETCDDGNTVGGDGCSATCTTEVCGNGTVDEGEACDDGVNDGSDCDPNCTIPACGNGVVGTGETCDDGNTAAADGCSASCEIEVCGDGDIGAQQEQLIAMEFTVLAENCAGDPAEEAFVRFTIGSAPPVTVPVPSTCDCLPGISSVRITDPVALAGIVDGANPLTIEHSPFVDFGWVNLTLESNRDVLSGTLAELTPGAGAAEVENLCELQRFTFGETVNTTLELGFETFIEECDDGANGDDTDGCNDDCLTVTCGNGRVDAAIDEECDDGNDAFEDGCTPDCILERCGDGDVQAPDVDNGPATLAETEPNDDGAPGTTGFEAGDDFDPIAANGPLLQSALVTGSIGPDGDEDWFAVTNPTATPYEVVARTSLGAVGACGGGDTVLAVRTEDGTVIARNDDRAPGDFCSELTFTLEPGQRLFVGVFEFGDNGFTALDYFLELTTGFVPARIEECDDGNDVGGDACDPNCTLPACGNGFADDTEACDDGNTVDGDGCTATCELERCGDGITQAGPLPIAVDFLWTAENCTGSPVQTVFTVDGVIALVEDSFRCGCFEAFARTRVTDPAVLRQFADGSAVIGVTFLGQPEEGSRFGWATAQIVFAEREPVAVLVANAVGDLGATPEALCFEEGVAEMIDDVQAQTGIEACDDGNAIDGDGCDTNCRLSGCGNGVTEPGEGCDDGNTNDNDGCSSFCLVESCGDGILQTSEGCDDGNQVDDDGCDGNCTITACGNGRVTTGEGCDDGNRVDTDDCRNDCTVNLCGNTRIDAGEECDDGNRIEGDGCTATCSLTFTFSGVARDLPEAHLLGWSECFADTYGDASNLASLPAQCGGSQLLLACREVGSDTLRVAAHAPTADVLTDTGDDAFSTNESNGVAWYFHDERSWGFAPAGAPVFKNTCDEAELFFDVVDGDQRLCWNMQGGDLSPGFRCGSSRSLAGPEFERVIYTLD